MRKLGLKMEEKLRLGNTIAKAQFLRYLLFDKIT